MAASSQESNVESVANLAGLVHQIFVGEVVPTVRFESVTAQTFKEAREGPDYRYDGSKMVGAVDLQRPTGAMGSDGHYPDHAHFTPQNWETTPVRRYRRIAVDLFTFERARQGPGTFEDFGARIFDQLWDSWFKMEIHHAVGSSDGTLCKCSSRTSSTVFVVKDGYGHASQNPLVMLDEGQVIAWIDVDQSNAVGGAATITDTGINYSNNTITVDSGSTWEPSNQLAANDLIVKATTNDSTASYFATEYQNAKNGLMDIVDPDANSTTVFNINQSTYRRWKPVRFSSGTFDHIEITEWLAKVRAKSTYPVTSESHTCICHPAQIAQLARTLVGFQQQQQLGKTLEGGYETVRVAGMDFAEDPYQLEDVMYMVCNEDLYTVPLLEAGFYDEDGSMWSRLQDYDGQEAGVRDYCNSFSPRRNRHAALTGITLSDVTAGDFNTVPNY